MPSFGKLIRATKLVKKRDVPVTCGYPVAVQTSDTSFLNVVEFNTPDEFIKFVNRIDSPTDPPRFFERLDRGRIKLFFDFDIDNKHPLYNTLRVMESEDQRAGYLIEEVSSLIDLEGDPIIHVGSRQRKYSYHIIFPTMVFDTMDELKSFVSPAFTLSFVDNCVYSSGRVFRMLGSSKYTKREYSDMSRLRRLDGSTNLTIADLVCVPNPSFNFSTVPHKSNEGLRPTNTIINLPPEVLELLSSYRITHKSSETSDDGERFLFHGRSSGEVRCIVGSTEKTEKRHSRDNIWICLYMRPNGYSVINVGCYRCGKSKKVHEIKTSTGRKHISFLQQLVTTIGDNKEYSWPRIDDKRIQYHTYSDRWLNLEKINIGDNVFTVIHSICETGKTQLIVEFVRKLFNPTPLSNSDDLSDDSVEDVVTYVVAITCRISLHSSIFTRLRGVTSDVISYRDDETSTVSGFGTGDRIRVVQLESLHTCSDLIKNKKNKRIILILDEYPNLISQTTSLSTHGSNLHKNQAILVELLGISSTVVALTGTPDSYSFQYLVNKTSTPINVYEYDLRPCAIRKTVTFVTKNKTMFESECALRQLSETKARGGELFKIAVIWTKGVKLKKGGESKINDYLIGVRSRHPNLNVFEISSKCHSVEFGKDPNAFIDKYSVDVLVYTSTIGVGVDITTPFRYTFGFISYITTSPADLVQAIYRVRDCPRVTLTLFEWNRNDKLMDIKEQCKFIEFFNNTTTEHPKINAPQISTTYTHEELIEVNRKRDEENKIEYINKLLHYLHLNLCEVIADSSTNRRLRSLFDQLVDKTPDLERRTMIINDLPLPSKERYDELNEKAMNLRPESLGRGNSSTREGLTEVELLETVKYQIYEQTKFIGKLTPEALSFFQTFGKTLMMLRRSLTHVEQVSIPMSKQIEIDEEVKRRTVGITLTDAGYMLFMNRIREEWGIDAENIDDCIEPPSERVAVLANRSFGWFGQRHGGQTIDMADTNRMSQLRRDLHDNTYTLWGVYCILYILGVPLFTIWRLSEKDIFDMLDTYKQNKQKITECLGLMGKFNTYTVRDSSEVVKFLRSILKYVGMEIAFESVEYKYRLESIDDPEAESIREKLTQRRAPQKHIHSSMYNVPLYIIKMNTNMITGISLFPKQGKYPLFESSRVASSTVPEIADAIERLNILIDQHNKEIESSDTFVENVSELNDDDDNI